MKSTDFMPLLESENVTKISEVKTLPEMGELISATIDFSSDLNSTPVNCKCNGGVYLYPSLDSDISSSPTPSFSSQRPSSPTGNTATTKSKFKPKPTGPKQSDPFQFGSRYLEDEDNVWDHNAWDHVETDDAYKEYIREQIKKQKEKPVTEFDKKRFNAHPERFWDLFYRNNRENFFKDRKWLGQEFPVLSKATAAPPSAPPSAQEMNVVKVLEVGAGAGNTLFPILERNRNPNFHITGVDFSAVGIEVIKSQPLYIQNHPNHVGAAVWDLANPEGRLPDGVEPESIDIMILIFVFSALAPWQWKFAIRNIKKVLKTGGQVLFRDYGRGDLAQVRFKSGRWLGENFYVRGDGTRVYFFEEDELRRIFEEEEDFMYQGEISEGINVEEREDEEKDESGYGKLKITNIGVDRRLLVNRKRLLKMYRCWMQLTATKAIQEDKSEVVEAVDLKN